MNLWLVKIEVLLANNNISSNVLWLIKLTPSRKANFYIKNPKSTVFRDCYMLLS